jgi:TonB-linked SusC/RagA family outer membrane protein
MLAAALVCSFAGEAQAQQTGQITGVVTDAQSGAPIAEVQVYIAGLGIGSLTRANGRFVMLNVPAGTHDLRAERIGFATQTQTITVAADGTAVADFQLATQSLGLDEIVVTGTAGAARRREIGNSISQINIAEVRERPTSVTNLLQGAAPGIEITGGDAGVGQGKQIRLRGSNSLEMTNQPIIYVDGVRIMDGAFPAVTTPGMTQGRGAFVTASPLDNINPNDIERIEIIKGSAATTLYGTEASAGVIQVFTKRGSTGAPVWTAEMQQGTGWAKEYGVNGVNYMHMEHFLRDAWWGGGYEGGSNSRPCITEATAPLPDDASYLLTAKPNSLWQGINGSADGACSFPGAQWYQNYSLSVRGGGNALQYYLSGQFQDDSGMLPLDELEKYNFQGNFTLSPIQDLQIQWNTGFTRQWQSNTPSGNNLSGIELQSMRQERNYLGVAGDDPRVIAQVLDYDFQQWIERLTTGLTLSYSPVADLTNRFVIGYDYAQQEVRNLMNFGFWEFPDGSLVNDVFQKRLLTFDYTGSYRFGLTDRVGSTFSWGGQAVGNDLRRVSAVGQNFPGASHPTLSSSAIQRAEEEREKVWNAGFFFQNVLDISDRYFITAGLRVDGNSAFGSGFGLQTYPKVSATWIVSDESFFSSSLGTLKLRTAYGQSGRAPGTFDAVRTWNPVGFLGEPAFRPDNRGNPDLGPEVTSEFEVGFDAAWLNDRVTVAFTYYDQVTRDALMDVSSVPSLGFSGAQLENVGKIGNKGTETQANATLLQTPDWTVDLGLGISTSSSKVLDLGGMSPFNALGGRIAEGHPVPVGWDDRRVANRDSIGPFRYIRCATPGCEDDPDRATEGIYVGSLYPTHFITPSLNVRVPGNIQLSARGEYRGGHVREVNPIPIGRSVRSPLCFPYYVDPANDIVLKPDTPALWRERCSPSNNDDYWFDADYFKLRAVSATVPVEFLFPQRISNAALTVTLANAFDWYREIPWWDPEILGNNAARDESVAPSTERTPAPATLRLSLRVTF